MINILEITDANFEEVVLNSDKPVLVYFWASGCAPCRLIEPIISLLTYEFEGRAIVGNLNIDQNKITSTQLGIHRLPTVLIFKYGSVKDKIVGIVDKSVLEQKLIQWS